MSVLVQVDSGQDLDIPSSIHSQYRHIDPTDLLFQPLDLVLGVSGSASTTLRALGMKTVYDLGSSILFSNARDICLLAEAGSGRFSPLGQLPNGVVKRDSGDIPLAKLPDEPITRLSSEFSDAELRALAEAIGATSIHDFAGWLPYRFARDVIDYVRGTPVEDPTSQDSSSPMDLLPQNGEYPTEQVHYEALLFDHFIEVPPNRLEIDSQPKSDPPNKNDKKKPVKNNRLDVAAQTELQILNGPVDVTQVVADEEPFSAPGVGGILTYTQSWFQKGVALGSLIHSVALGPGESTRLAVIDWARKENVAASESVSETEALTSDVYRSRALNEITRAVAAETQQGRSGAQTQSTSTQSGQSSGSAGLSQVNLLDFLNPPSPGVTTSGTSYGSSNNAASASSWSLSSGYRDVQASLAQDILDRTQEAAHSARNRRASIVREVSQRESESISARTITNYNHMHALTVEYYEVIQIYKTVVELSKADPCVFIPMKLLDFSSADVIDRYRDILAGAALAPAVKEALQFKPRPSSTLGVALFFQRWFVPMLYAPAVPVDVVTHLQNNKLYYSQAVWRSLDSETIRNLLAGYAWPSGGKPKRLLEVVDPAAVAVVGHYLVFRAPGMAHAEYEQWLEDRKLKKGQKREDLVPVPSGGVFAEAVLGRFNSAEKLDLTRFWNWQESPIPVQAPDIAPIQAASRAIADNTVPGQLGEHVLNVVNPPALPDPQGMSAVLAAVQNGNAFRDMSGLAATVGLAQAGLQAAQQGSTSAAAQAGQNAAVAAELGAKVAELAAKLIAAYFTGGASLAAGGVQGLGGLAGGISGQGAKINYGREMDKRGASASQQPAGAGGTNAKSGSNLKPVSGGGVHANTDDIGVSSGGNEAAAFNAALGTPFSAPAEALNAVLGTLPQSSSGSVTSPALEPPPARLCCLLGFSGAIDPADVKDHEYGSTSTSNVGYVYTPKAGIIDVAHVRDHVDLTKYVYDAILAGYESIPCRDGTATLQASPADPIATAQAIAYADSWAHELRTFGKMLPGMDNSSFSPEDLPSNYLGTYIGALAVQSLGIASSFNSAVDTLLAGILASFGARSKSDTEAVLASLEGRWWDPGLFKVDTKLLRRNFDGTPWLAGAEYDDPPPTKLIDPSSVGSMFTTFGFRTKPLLSDGTTVELSDFAARTEQMRQLNKERGNSDKP